jgi:ribonucleoside-triphosphate reductase
MIEKPHSFSTACNIATQIIAQVASNQYGGQTISLAHLAPFVDVSRQKIRAEVFEDVNCDSGCKLSEDEISHIVEKRVRREVKRGVQTIQYQINTLLTTNGQTPFVTVFMYLDEVPEGQTRDDLALIIEETLLQRIEGVKNEKGVWITPAFPKLIYVLDEDNIQPGTKYYYLTELAAKCTAKRMVPDYISAKVMKQLKGDVYACMGCRSFLTPSDDHKYYGRFNQGVVTINLVDIACSAGGDENKFWQLLNERCELCRKALMCRHERLKGTPSDVAPILWQNGALARLKDGEIIDDLLYNNYSTISLGYAGIAEMTYRMTGCSHTEPDGKAFALKVMRFLNDKCSKWRAETNISFSLYGTPMESVTYKFAQCLQRRHGIIPHVTDKSYITNSYHVHVTEPIDAFSKLTFEAEFQALSPGGAISYVEVPNLQNNIPAVLALMRHIYETILYAELNTKSDYCQVCGYDGEIQITEEDGKLIWECPNCGNRDQRTLNVCRRTCGYLGTQFWNQGRTAEIKDRVMHL